MKAIDGRSKKISILTLMAVVLLVPIYLLPVWWVSLTAPNYPAETFPDGVKIVFQMNGIFNGCEFVEKAEIQEDESLDCVHEMDTINHYVGMYPIASGGPIEVSFSLFLSAILGVMLLGYITMDPKKRTIILSAGFAAVTLWMVIVFYTDDGIKYHSARYLDGRVTTLGQSSDDEPEKQLTAAEAMIAKLKESLAKSGIGEKADTDQEKSKKQKSIGVLKSSFEADQKKIGAAGEEWKGSGSQVLSWHYRKSLGKYFNDPAEINPMVNKMTMASHVIFVLLMIVMVIFVIGARKTNGIFHQLLVYIPIGLPGYFVLLYSIWLGWYGHNMSSMGAFTLKPFMPTVFGQGKVAQFTTNSYPSAGFYLMLAFSILLLLAALMRKKQSQEGSE
jgi:hypothetical protein